MCVCVLGGGSSTFSSPIWNGGGGGGVEKYLVRPEVCVCGGGGS